MPVMKVCIIFCFLLGLMMNEEKRGGRSPISDWNKLVTRGVASVKRVDGLI